MKIIKEAFDKELGLANVKAKMMFHANMAYVTRFENAVGFSLAQDKFESLPDTAKIVVCYLDRDNELHLMKEYSKLEVLYILRHTAEYEDNPLYKSYLSKIPRVGRYVGCMLCEPTAEQLREFEREIQKERDDVANLAASIFG